MKRKLLVCALVACAMTLCLALTGCGGGGATNDKDAKEAFIGSWKLAGMVSDGEEATAEDIAMLDAFGMSVGLNVNEDGTCALIMFGEPLDGTWEAKSATEAKFTIDGSPITATITDGKLQMTDDGYAMTFERGEVKANSNDGDSKAASTTDKSTVAVDKVLVDDENCTITVLNKKQDWLDDCGYTFKVENKTADKTVLFMAEYGTFSVDGQMVDFTLTETVKPGMFAETFGYFDSTKVTDIDTMKNVAGTISLMDNDTYDAIASYPIEIA